MVKNEVNHVVGDVFTDNTLINDLRPKNNLHILVLSVPFLYPIINLKLILYKSKQSET